MQLSKAEEPVDTYWTVKVVRVDQDLAKQSKLIVVICVNFISTKRANHRPKV